jgi:hypothetical protein
MCNSSYHSVWNKFSLYFLHKNIKFRGNITVISDDDVCGCETWSLSLRLEHGEGVQLQGAKEDNYSLRGSNMRPLKTICAVHQRLFRWANQREREVG